MMHEKMGVDGKNNAKITLEMEVYFRLAFHVTKPVNFHTIFIADVDWSNRSLPVHLSKYKACNAY
ncbi:MAG: hypothetical protein EOO01_13405 [Chitinophagaceae bacterium]|nr:MAG: hypothetical protein EOO01_13405 [Chitinophagaceae bacterium]